jgi:hypothetical protein
VAERYESEELSLIHGLKKDKEGIFKKDTHAEFAY